LYPVTDAPKYKKGFPASLGFVIGMCGWVFVVRVFELRALRRKVERVDVEDERGERSSEEAVAVKISAVEKK
jgi:ACS family pantothenate transporter-like MFS transporter